MKAILTNLERYRYKLFIEFAREDKMYRKILVPMDGSELSECSLEHVKEIARGCQVPEVVLLTVVEQYEGAGYSWGGVVTEQQLAEEAKRTEAKAAVYLKKVAAGLAREGLCVNYYVLSGTPTDVILDYARKNDVDLIIMSTHGRSGPGRWAIGSVADRVIRYSSIPVVVVSPKGCRVG